MVNKAVLLGYAGKDPEIGTTASGRKYASFGLATSESWRDKTSGERKQHTDWHQIIIWNENLVSVAERFVRKGSKLYLEGKIQTRKWQDKSGQDRYTTEIVLNGFNAVLLLLDRQEREGAPPPDEPEYGRPVAAREPAYNASLDNEIPF